MMGQTIGLSELKELEIVGSVDNSPFRTATTLRWPVTTGCR